jgi:hypothetical protein
MRAFNPAMLSVVALAAAGCAAPMNADSPSTPARFAAAPSSACIEQIRVFTTQQTGRGVTLTDKAFADSDVLLLERPILRGPDGRPLDGRSMERPEVFKLVQQAGQCVLVHERTGARQVLQGCNCVPHTLQKS